MPTEPIQLSAGFNARASLFSLAGFQVTFNGRFWVTAEGITTSSRISEANQ